MPRSPSSVAPIEEGEVLAGKYRIERVIGVGGMGVVVAAMHLELEQRVALKFLLPQAAQSEELVGRFVREAKATVKLNGKHVAKVLDVGRMEDGRPYIVMEYLEGHDLGVELQEAVLPFPITDVVSWMLQACEGLAEAHALGIVHRDLKPANLFLTRAPDRRPHVKVLDFGISKAIDPSASEIKSLTKTEMLLGSPLYMAPEQMRSSKYVDERSDIWGLGAIAYELFTLKVPFEAETILDLAFKVAQEPCIPVQEVRADVPLALSDIVMRCLEKEPEARFSDIGELAVALEQFAAPDDIGSAARTIKVLASGDARVRARGDLRKLSSANRKFTSVPPPATAPTGPPPPPPPVQVLPADGRTSGAVAAPSAWGATNAAEIARSDRERSRRVIAATIVGVGLVIGGGVLLVSRGNRPAAAPPPAAQLPSAPPSPPPEPVVSAAPSATNKPRPTLARPSPSTKPSAAAAPSASASTKPRPAWPFPAESASASPPPSVPALPPPAPPAPPPADSD